jgi:redox-sensing transcriptional repressor
MPAPEGVPLPAARRLPLYRRVLKEKAEEGEAWASSDAIAERLSLSAVQVRKDLSAVGALGSPKRGFPVDETLHLLESFIGADDLAEVFLVGAGELGAAVLADEGLARRGFHIVALFDPVSEREGKIVGGLSVLPLSRLPDLARRMGVRIAVLGISGPGLREAVDELAASSLCGILDLSGTAMPFPGSITVLREDYGSRLSTLAGSLVLSDRVARAEAPAEREEPD